MSTELHCPRCDAKLIRPAVRQRIVCACGYVLLPVTLVEHYPEKKAKIKRHGTRDWRAHMRSMNTK